MQSNNTGPGGVGGAQGGGAGRSGMTPGLPEATSANVVVRAKNCPVLDAQRLRVVPFGPLDIKLFTTPDGDPPNNPIMRLRHGFKRPVEGIIVTRQNIAGSVLLLFPGDPDWPLDPPPVELRPTVDLSRELVVKATAPGMVVRLLAF